MTVDFPFPPPGACDCHVHVVGPKTRFPLSPNRPYTPHDATLADLKAMMARLGTTRGVVVQPSIYGTDNACTMDAVDRLSGNGRAVVVVKPDTPSSALDALDRRGARGVRINAVSIGETGLEPIQAEIAAAAAVCARNGWHVQLFIPPAVLAALGDFLRGLPVEVVIDHFGLVSMGPEGAAQVEHLARLLATGRIWVKLSGSYRVAKDPYDPALTSIARRLAAANPERVVWASDWPHTPGGKSTRPATEEQPNLPIDTPALLELARRWLPEASDQTRLLVDNPARLYRFD